MSKRIPHLLNEEEMLIALRQEAKEVGMDVLARRGNVTERALALILAQSNGALQLCFTELPKALGFTYVSGYVRK